MTNKERYKQAFSALQSSRKLSLEVEEMAEFQKKRKKNIAAAAAVACAVIICGSGTAYAADLGGIQEKVSVWLYGTKTEVEVEENGNGGYTMRLERDGNEEEILGFGGVAINDDGSQTWLTADDLITTINESANVEEDANGRVWIYYYDQKSDITDLFDADGICRVAIMYNGKTAFVKVEREEDGSYPFSQTDDLSKEEIEKYIYISAQE